MGRRHPLVCLHAALALLLLLLTATAALHPTSASAYEARVPSSFFGINADLMPLLAPGRSAELDRQLASIDSLGVDWVRSNIAWSDIEPAAPVAGAHTYNWTKLDAYVTALARHGLAMMPIPQSAPVWARSTAAAAALCGSDSAVSVPRAADYGAMLRALVKRYGPGGTFWASRTELTPRPLTAVELWNEPNWRGSWCPRPDPESYAALALAGANGAHEGSPAVMATLGGLADAKEDAYFSDGSLKGIEAGSFLQRMTNAQPALRSAIDSVAVHSYDPDPDGTIAFLGWLRMKMTAAGLGHASMTMTEFGWHTSTAEQAVSEEERAANLRKLVGQLARTDCDLTGVSPYAWTTRQIDPAYFEDWFGLADPETAQPYPSGIAYRETIDLYRGRGPTVPPRYLVPVCSAPTPPDQDGDGTADPADDFPLDPQRSTGSGEVPPPPPGPAPRLHPPRVPDEFFGMSVPVMADHPAGRQAYYDSVATTGVGVVRESIFWAHQEPLPPSDPAHNFAWSRSDSRVLALAKRGIRALPTFIRPPGWLPPSNAAANSAYAAFMAGYARRYGMGGSFWAENGNLDRSLAQRSFEVFSNGNLPEGAWDRTPSPAEYADLYLATRTAVRGVDPGARAVASLSRFGANQSSSEFVRAMVAARPALAGKLDAVLLNILQPQSAEEVDDAVRRLRTALDGSGNPQASITVEVGWSTGGPGAISEAQRAELYAQVASRLPRSDCGVDGMLANAWASMAQDTGNLWDWLGIAELSDGSLKPSAAAYRDTLASFTGRVAAKPPSQGLHPCGAASPDRDRDGVLDPADPAPLDPTSRSPTATAPQTPVIATAPAALTASSQATITFSGAGASGYLCQIDTDITRTCDAGALTLSGLADGRHTLAVRSVDALGLLSAPVRHTWTIDTRAPETSIRLSDDPVLGDRATVTIEANERAGEVWCGLDRAWGRCGSTVTLQGLSEGKHVFAALTFDEAGNRDPSTAIREFRVVLTPDRPAIAAGPAGGAVSGPQPGFSFRTPGAIRAECRFDGVAFGPCDSADGHRSHSALASGTHTFEVRGIGGTGRAGPPASASFVVDGTAPQVKLLRRQSAGARSASFLVQASDRSALRSPRCQLDGRRVRPCGSTVRLRRLKPGGHRLSVSLADVWGNDRTTVARWRTPRR